MLGLSGTLPLVAGAESLVSENPGVWNTHFYGHEGRCDPVAASAGKERRVHGPLYSMH